MSNLAEAIPYDEQARDYFEKESRFDDICEREYEQRCQQEKERILGQIHDLLEEIGEDFLYEDAKVQAEKVENIRDRAHKLLCRCEDYAEVDRNGI